MTSASASNTAQISDRSPRKHQVFSPARIAAIASNTLLELVRLKVFYFLLLFALALIASSIFSASLFSFTTEEQFQLLKDVSLGAMSIFTWLLAMLTTAMLLPRDIEDRTLYTILAKPVPRLEYLLGKLAGVLFMLLISTLVMSAMFAIALYIRQESAISTVMSGTSGTPVDEVAAQIETIKANAFTTNLIAGVAVIYLKAAVFATITLFISTYASSWIFTIMISVAVYLIGHFEGVARESWIASREAFGQSPSPLAKVFLALVSIIFPDMQLFNLVDDIVAGNEIPLRLLLNTFGIGCGYIVIYLLVAYLVFANKEL